MFRFNGTALRRFRKLHKLSQESLAELLDCSLRYISALENGQKDNPSASFLFRCGDVLDVPPEALMTQS